MTCFGFEEQGLSSEPAWPLLQLINAWETEEWLKFCYQSKSFPLKNNV